MPAQTSSLNFARSIVLCVLFVVCPVSQAQMSLASAKSEPSTQPVDETTVLSNAIEGFRATVGNLLLNLEQTDNQLQSSREFVADSIVRFEKEVHLLVNDLKGDGVLDAKEVTSEVGDLRTSYINRIEEVFAAHADNVSPPPAVDGFESRWEYLQASAKYTFMVRNGWTDWLMLAGCLLGGLLLSWLVNKALRLLTKSSKNSKQWLVHLSESLAGPLGLAIIALALHLGFQWLWIPGIAGDFLSRLNSVLLIAASFWFLWNACESVAQGLAWIIQKTYQAPTDRHVVLVLSRALRIVVLAAFVLVVVNVVLDSNLTGLIAGLGVIGVILTFILRGTIENIAASFTIFGDKPFRVGDLVVYDDTWGRIEDIGFRSTRFRTLSGHLITIPNSKLIDDAIHNVGARPSIRRRFRIGLPYETAPDKVDKAIGIVRELLDNHRGQPQDQPAHVAFERYAAYELVLLIQYYFEPADYWEALEFDTEVNLAIMRRFAEEDIAFAYPTQSLHLHSDDERLMQVAADSSSVNTGTTSDPGIAC